VLISERYQPVMSNKRETWAVQRNRPRVNVDQARLPPHLRGDRRNGELPGTAALDDALEAEAELVRRQPGRVVVPSPGSFRGLPAVGSGPGAIAGTNPAAALLAKERRRR
jgi:hypothetical protein